MPCYKLFTWENFQVWAVRCFIKLGDVVWARLWFPIIDFWQSITIDNVFLNFYCYRFLIPIDKNNWSVLSTDFRYQSLSIDDAWKYAQSDCLSIITHSYYLSRWVGMTMNLLKHKNVSQLLACITFSDIFIAVNLIRFVPTMIVTIASPILTYALAIVAGKLIWPAFLVSCSKKIRN